MYVCSMHDILIFNTKLLIKNTKISFFVIIIICVEENFPLIGKDVFQYFCEGYKIFYV